VTPLPDDVLYLMYLIHGLVEAVCWEAKPTNGSQGEAIIAEIGYAEAKSRESCKA